MPLNVEQMSSLSAYVMSGSTADKYIEDAEIPEEDQLEAREYFAIVEYRNKNKKPGEQITIPSDWS